MKQFYKDLTNTLQFGAIALLIRMWLGATMFCILKGYSTSVILEGHNIEALFHVLALLQGITSVSFSWTKEDGTKIKSWNYSCFK